MLAVPDLPPTMYPGTCARWPVPFSTTLLIIIFILSEVSSDITLLLSSGLFLSITLPLASTISFIRVGLFKKPPLEIALTAFISCKGETAIECP